jgi:hypothetical protein
MVCPKHSVSSDIVCKGIRILRLKTSVVAKKQLAETKTNARGQARPKKIVKKSTLHRHHQSNTYDKTNDIVSTPIDVADESVVSKNNRLADFQKRRGLVASIYFDEEAEADSDDDSHRDDEEDRLCRQMEDDEALSQDSFINDNEHLTQHASQDELDIADPHARHHRSVDAQRERDNLWATPLLTRRPQSNEERLSLPSSDRALGQMHFIRSLMEHARNGGDVNEVEATYQRLAQNGTQWSPSTSQIAIDESIQDPNVYDNSRVAVQATASAVHNDSSSIAETSSSNHGGPSLQSRHSSRNQETHFGQPRHR